MDETREFFRFVKGYDNYMISNFGRVFNLKSLRMLKLHTSKRGYNTIGLYKYGISKTRRVHILIANAFFKNPENKKMVDHIDGNGLNNNISNLRWATGSENSQNAKLSKKNTSGFKGVSFNKKKQKWEVKIGINNKYKHLGYYTDIEYAKAARKKAVDEYFGQFANACEMY